MSNERIYIKKERYARTAVDFIHCENETIRCHEGAIFYPFNKRKKMPLSRQDAPLFVSQREVPEKRAKGSVARSKSPLQTPLLRAAAHAA